MKITERTKVRLSLNVLWATLPVIIFIGVWVGTIQAETSNTKDRLERQKDAILGMKTQIDELQNSTARIEGKLEILINRRE